MEFKTFLQSKKTKWVLTGIGALVILLIIFSLGVYVGTRKADFSFRWGENYHRAFGGPQGGFFQDFGGQDFIPGNGTVGTVMKIEGNLIIVKSPDGIEKTIAIDAQTTIRRGRDTIKISDIKIDNQLVTIGSPNNDGAIQAKFIRVFDQKDNLPPTPPGMIRFPFPKL